MVVAASEEGNSVEGTINCKFTVMFVFFQSHFFLGNSDQKHLIIPQLLRQLPPHQTQTTGILDTVGPQYIYSNILIACFQR